MSWPKHLSVNKKIVELLSASTYNDFPRALRELISNAYDADASRVDVSIDRKKGAITIFDNGVGMTPEEFDYFLQIAGTRRKKRSTILFERKRIGQFGVGFLAMFPFCEKVRIESTVQGSPLLFRAEIPAKKYFSEANAFEDVSAINISGKEYKVPSKRNSHFTKIELVNTNTLLDLYFSKEIDSRRKVDSIYSWSGMERLKWDLQEILPLPYQDNSLIATAIDIKDKNFRVTLNKKELRTNEYINDVLDCSDGVEAIGSIRFKYVLGTAWKIVKPDQARGIRVRLNGVGVGPREFFDLNRQGRTFSRLNWINGEVHVLEGLDDSLTLDRENFKATQEFEEFKDFLRDKIRKVHTYIENVDESRKTIESQVNQSKRAAIQPKWDVIDTQIGRLEKRGFKVSEEKKSTSKTDAKPVKIDIKKREVFVNRTSKRAADSITVGGKKWVLEYEDWSGTDSELLPCEIISTRKVVLNTAYPLFSGAHKDIFRRLAILIAMAGKETNTKNKMQERIWSLILKEFR